MTPWMYDTVKILAAALLVIINGFFVAAEFALVKVRTGRLEELVKNKRPFAVTARWTYPLVQIWPTAAVNWRSC